MKKLLLIGCVLICASQAVAQVTPSEYTLKVTPDDINIISEALGNQPFNKVVNLVGKLRQQVIEQQMPKAPVIKKPDEPDQK